MTGYIIKSDSGEFLSHQYTARLFSPIWEKIINQNKGASK